ncbi:hypothetical protein A8B82_14870 [Sulfitobacter sp. EhC04]|uniref:hypothetical protein n=1 Tax=Sulfitobacter sp. EhC04 TaxID=1849168 RepID=UPI0007F4319D|nr:hypothetical protein [Sulfitobacter sp. EhC04]OAN76679.1 hypothetical protein A8B82_14870 [Sulfitobacter sp. EhC04]
MPDLWFVEERNPFGGWSPATFSGEKPTEKQVGGRRKEFRNDPERVHPGHRDLTLPQLFEVYSPDGKFYLPRRVA